MLQRLLISVSFLCGLASSIVPDLVMAASSPNVDLAGKGNPKELRISFDQAENEVLARFRQDLPRIESLSNKVILYEVTASGELPTNYNESLRSKLSRVILTSNKLRLVDCPQCQVSRLVKDENGQLRYESSSGEPNRPAKMAAEAGVQDLMYADLQYSPDDVRLRLRLVSAPKQEVLWTAEYSTSDSVKDRGKLVTKEYDYEVLTNGDSLSQVLIGEIAFSMAFSPGIFWVPTIDNGNGSQRVFYPSVDILIGEKFDSGYKRFGFLFGGAFNAADGSSVGKLLPWIIRVAPQFRYTFNPYNTSFARFSISSEIGGLISSGLATAYIGAGPEVTLVKRFSLSLLPMFILPTTIKGGQVMVVTNGVPENQAQNDQGKFGGFALLIKGSMNW